jgi:hypothetical protein
MLLQQFFWRQMLPDKIQFSVYSTASKKNYKVFVKTDDIYKLRVSKIKRNLLKVTKIPIDGSL